MGSISHLVLLDVDISGQSDHEDSRYSGVYFKEEVCTGTTFDGMRRLMVPSLIL